MKDKNGLITDMDVQLLNKELENVAAGSMNMTHRYTCVNPNCSMYLRYLQFQPPMGKCEVCGEFVGEVM